MRTLATTLLILALAPPAFAQSLGEVTAATGIHGTLSRQGVGDGASDARAGAGDDRGLAHELTHALHPQPQRRDATSRMKPAARSRKRVRDCTAPLPGRAKLTPAYVTPISRSRPACST